MDEWGNYGNLNLKNRLHEEGSYKCLSIYNDFYECVKEEKIVEIHIWQVQIKCEHKFKSITYSHHKEEKETLE